MNQADFIKEILIVLVLYKKSIRQSPGFKAIEEIIALYPSAVTIFVYDNSPDPQCESFQNIIYRHDPENNGVSRAYNEACKVAVRLRKKWMLLLDQDSEITQLTFNAYQRAVLHYPGLPLFAPIMKDPVGIVSPFRFRYGKGCRLKKIIPGIHSLQDVKIINSGMLITIKAFCNTLGFDERFPLDLSDIVFLDRFSIQYPQFVLIDAICKHDLSALDSHTEAALNRFKIFSRAMHLYKGISKEKIRLRTILLSRSLKLFFYHRKVEFLKIGFEQQHIK